MKRKLLSAFLALTMVLSLVPFSALAAKTKAAYDQNNCGKVVELTKDLVKQETTMETVVTDSDQIPVTTVTVAPKDPVAFSPAANVRPYDGWWVGISIQAPAGIDLDHVLFRNNNDYTDRAWKPSIDGGSESASDPYYMTAWNGPSVDQLKSGKTDYNVAWYFNWDGNRTTGVTIPATSFKKNGADDSKRTPMEGVDQIVKLKFELTDNVKLLDKDGNTAWPITITFSTGAGATAVPAQKVGLNGKITKPSPDPTRSGYTFGGWYKESGCTNAWDFNTDIVTADTTLYAKWTQESVSHTVTFDSQGGSAVASQTVTSGGKVTKPADPTRSGYTFDGWYKESGCTNAWNFSADTVTADTTLYARWTAESASSNEYRVRISSSRHGDIDGGGWYEAGERVTLTVDPDANYRLSWIEAERTDSGRQLELTRSGDRYTFTMPDSNVTIDAGFVFQEVYINDDIIPPAPAVFIPTFQLTTQYQQRPAVDFPDIPWESWAYQPARWAYQNGYIDLAADGGFYPNAGVFYIQIWSIMAQWMGESFQSPQEIVTWAYRNGAAADDPPYNALTRNDLIVYLYKCYFLMGGDTSSTANLAAFSDSRLIVGNVNRNAWTWAVGQGIISGTMGGRLEPERYVTRGEFATILMRLCQK